MEIQWRTYDGKTTFIHEMTHEHISSLYYYMKYVKIHIVPEVVDEVNRVITEKYNGIILPYRPPSDVIGEIETLHFKNMLRYDKLNHKYNIHDENGVWIGEIILKPDQEVDEETGKLKIDRIVERIKNRNKSIEEKIKLCGIPDEDDYDNKEEESMPF
jgi:hypothetical protein